MGQAMWLRSMLFVSFLLVCAGLNGQEAPSAPAPAPAAATSGSQPPADTGLQVRTAANQKKTGCKDITPTDAADAVRISKLAIVNGCPYDQPSAHDQFIDYLNDSYGLPAMGRNVVRAAYSQAQDNPSKWDEDFTGFMQRYGAAAVTTALVGNIRYGMENVFHEDLRYIPCHGCRFKKKVENALLAEITARHDEDGHRFFTLTPTVADFMGPIIAHSIPLYPGGLNPAAGAVSARLVFATRIGAHLFTEFVLERRHKDKPMEK
jgi:hypothetical protein